MKKTIAMLSALAISASIVMPFSAFAEDAVQVTKVDAAAIASFTEEQMVKYFNLTDVSSTPRQITVDDTSVTEVYVPDRYEGEKILLAVYDMNYGGNRGGWQKFTVDEVKEKANAGTLFMFGTPGTVEEEPAVVAAQYKAVKVENYTSVSSAAQAKAFFDSLGAVTFSSVEDYPDTIVGLPTQGLYRVYGWYTDSKLGYQYYSNGVKEQRNYFSYSYPSSIGNGEYVIVPVNTITAEDGDPANAATNVKYNIDPTYTITIPAAVELTDENVTATFKVEGTESGSAPLLAKDARIIVTLAEAANGFSGDDEKDLTVKTAGGKGTATYNVLNAGGVKVGKGEEIANFLYQPDQDLTEYWTQKATFTAPVGATYAGVYTDTLTFNIRLD